MLTYFFNIYSPSAPWHHCMQVVPDFDQPKVAAFLASVINNGNLSSKYCVEGIIAATEYNRVAIAKKLLPFCNDLAAEGADNIKSALTDWEKVVLESDFRNNS